MEEYLNKSEREHATRLVLWGSVELVTPVWDHGGKLAAVEVRVTRVSLPWWILLPLHLCLDNNSIDNIDNIDNKNMVPSDQMWPWYPLTIRMCRFIIYRLLKQLC